MFKIKYYYRTGDSFHSEDTEDILEYDWKDLEFAKESLQRIKEHYDWYDYETNHWSEKVSKPKWHKVNITENDRWIEPHQLINLRIDEDNEVQFLPPWCGYFEHLYSAEIILNEKIITK